MHERANFNRKQSLTAGQQDRFVRLYEQSLQYLDTQIGRLLSYLERSGYDSNTIVVLVSDHGEEFFDHGRWGHWESNLYDEILKVPLIIRLPGRTNGQVIRRQVRLLDLMPTILELCECSAPDGLQVQVSHGLQAQVDQAGTEHIAMILFGQKRSCLKCAYDAQNGCSRNVKVAGYVADIQAVRF